MQSLRSKQGGCPRTRSLLNVRQGTTVIAAENSELPDLPEAPSVPVAVAVTTEPATSEPENCMLKLALPLPSVVTLSAPIQVWPSP